MQESEKWKWSHSVVSDTLSTDKVFLIYFPQIQKDNKSKDWITNYVKLSNLHYIAMWFLFFLAALVLHCSAQDSSRILELAASGALRLSSYDTSFLLHHTGLVSCPTSCGVLVSQLGTEPESLHWKDWTTKEASTMWFLPFKSKGKNWVINAIAIITISIYYVTKISQHSYLKKLKITVGSYSIAINIYGYIN